MSTMKWNLNSHVWGWVYLWKYALKNSYISRHFGGLGIEKIRQNLGQTADSLSHLAFSSRLVLGAWCFKKPCWVLVGFRSLRLGFQISMLGFSTLRLGFQISMLGFTTLRLPFGKKNCFFRLGFINKNQLGIAGSSFLRKRYINTIPSLLWKSKKKSFVWFLLRKPSRKKLFFCEKPAVRQ